MDNLDEVYPVCIVQDRYTGVYSGGLWVAIATHTDSVPGGGSRYDMVMAEAMGGDGDSDHFWRDPANPPPDWVAVGNTPDEALKKLLSRATD